MRSKTNFRDLPGLLARAHRSLRIVRHPGSGVLCVKTAGPRSSIVGLIAENDECDATELLLKLEHGRDWADLLIQLAALLHERATAGETTESAPGAQVTTRLH